MWVLRRGLHPGTAAWIAVLGWGVTAWLVEPFRAESATLLGGLRTIQVIGMGAAIGALWMLRRRVERQP